MKAYYLYVLPVCIVRGALQCQKLFVCLRYHCLLYLSTLGMNFNLRRKDFARIVKPLKTTFVEPASESVFGMPVGGSDVV